jgi:dihydroxyacetone kinase-like predicted kinase
LADTVTKYLDGAALADALTSGIHKVIGAQEFLNRINVFPVADGDTGTNLSLSLGAALATTKQPGDKHLGTLLAAIADTLLDSARGNSGAILAQFFQGMSDSAGELTRFTTYTFSKAARLGSEYAHDALSNPREGTILSVMATFAETLNAQARSDHEGNFPTVMKRALQQTKITLAKTQEQLEELRKAGVVDAGAKGFVELVHGMTEYIRHGRIAEEPDLTVLHDEDALMLTVGSGADSEYRYCTECLVTGADIDRRKLRETLSVLGDSLVLAGTKRKAKIHVHVNDPEIVFKTAPLPTRIWSAWIYTWCPREFNSVIAAISIRSASRRRNSLLNSPPTRTTQQRRNRRRVISAASSSSSRAILRTSSLLT